jgi:hypothetical protein
MSSREMAATVAVAIIGLVVIGAVLGLVALTSPVP